MKVSEEQIQTYKKAIATGDLVATKVTEKSHGLKEYEYHLHGVVIQSISTTTPIDGLVNFFSEEEWLEFKKNPKIAATQIAAAKPSGVSLIALERERQLDKGYDAEHDSYEENEELAVVAGLYALDTTYAWRIIKETTADYPDEDNVIKTDLWPWKDMEDKRGKIDRVEQLVQAGALIAAEIDRLQAEQIKNERNNRR